MEESGEVGLELGSQEVRAQWMHGSGSQIERDALQSLCIMEFPPHLMVSPPHLYTQSGF